MAPGEKLLVRMKSLKWKDSDALGQKSRHHNASTWPIISRLSLRLPAGEIVRVPLARALPFTLWVSVRTGCLDLWFGPANPTDEQADIRHSRITEPLAIRLTPGAYTLYFRAAEGMALTANLTAIGETYA